MWMCTIKFYGCFTQKIHMYIFWPRCLFVFLLSIFRHIFHQKSKSKFRSQAHFSLIIWRRTVMHFNCARATVTMAYSMQACDKRKTHVNGVRVVGLDRIEWNNLKGVTHLALSFSSPRQNVTCLTFVSVRSISYCAIYLGLL
jgi:hypothetical protein